MRLLLKNFSQDVDFLNPEETTNYLVFVDEQSTKSYRLPVPLETIQELIRMTRSGEEATRLAPPPEPAPVEEPGESFPEGSETFGEDEEYDEEMSPEGPESEEAVQSI